MYSDTSPDAPVRVRESRWFSRAGRRPANEPFGAGIDETSDRYGHYAIRLADGAVVNGRTVIVATGAQHNRLELSEFERYEGAGVSYAATQSEAQLCAGDPVLIVGGGNSAGQAAMFLSQARRELRPVDPRRRSR